RQPGGSDEHPRSSSATFDKIVRGYGRALNWVLDHPRLMLVATVATVALTILLAIKVPKGLFPQQDTGMLAGFTEASQDISSSAMQARQKQANAIVMADPDVAEIVSFVGAANGSTGNTGTVFV